MTPSHLGPFRAAGTITSGLYLERVSSGGLEKVQILSADLTEAGNELPVGFANEDRTGTTDVRPVAIAPRGEPVLAISNAGWARTVKWLTAKAGGKLAASASGDIIVALNTFGEAPGAGDVVVRVEECSPWVRP